MSGKKFRIQAIRFVCYDVGNVTPEPLATGISRGKLSVASVPVYHSAKNERHVARWLALRLGWRRAMLLVVRIVRGTVAQWQSRGLLSLVSWVRIPPVSPTPMFHFFAHLCMEIL